MRSGRSVTPKSCKRFAEVAGSTLELCDISAARDLGAARGVGRFNAESVMVIDAAILFSFPVCRLLSTEGSVHIRGVVPHFEVSGVIAMNNVNSPATGLSSGITVHDLGLCTVPVLILLASIVTLL